MIPVPVPLPAQAAVWERWMPDAASLARLRRWRRPRRLWVDADAATDAGGPEAAARLVGFVAALAGMGEATRHRFRIATADPTRLAFAFFSWSLSRPRGALPPPHVALGLAVGADPEGGKAVLGAFGTFPVARRFLYLTTPAVRPEALWEWAGARPGSRHPWGPDRVLVDQTVAAGAPRWFAALTAAGQGLGVAVEAFRPAAPGRD